MKRQRQPNKRRQGLNNMVHQVNKNINLPMTNLSTNQLTSHPTQITAWLYIYFKLEMITMYPAVKQQEVHER